MDAFFAILLIGLLSWDQFCVAAVNPRKQAPPSWREIQQQRSHLRLRDAGSKGLLWPLPQQYDSKDKLLSIEQFRFAVKGPGCSILDAAIQRYYQIIFQRDWLTGRAREDSFGPVQRQHHIPALSQLYVSVNSQNPCGDSDLPDVNMDEHYEIQIRDPKFPSLLVGNTVWGVIRGLETFR
jgi:beta-acetyl hexosaminidase like